MYGYEPKNDPPPGSWGDIFAMTRVVLEEVAKPLAAILVVLGLVLTTLFLYFTHPVYALIPLAVLAGLGYWVWRRDQRAIREAEDQLPR